MARAVSRNAKIGWTIGAWIVALLIFFPILYAIITSFKTGTDLFKVSYLPTSLDWTNYLNVLGCRPPAVDEHRPKLHASAR